MNNMLNEISFKELSNSHLTDTPARLKLRSKTLSGINTKMERIEAVNSVFSIPTADLAKKKKDIAKKVEEKKEEVKDIVVEEKETNNMDINKTSEIFSSFVDGNRKLKIAPDKKETFIKFSDYQDEPEYNLEEGKSGDIVVAPTLEVAPINEEKVVSLDEARAKLFEEEEVKPVIEATPIKEEDEEVSAMQEADAEKIYIETSKLKDEVKELQQKDKELVSKLGNAKEEYNNAINVGTDLEKTLAAKKEEKNNKKKEFFKVAQNQNTMLKKYKSDLLKRQEDNQKELDDVNMKTSSAIENNMKKEEEIKVEDDGINKYDNLIEAITSFDVPAMEVEEPAYQYGKVA